MLLFVILPERDHKLGSAGSRPTILIENGATSDLQHVALSTLPAPAANTKVREFCLSVLFSLSHEESIIIIIIIILLCSCFRR